MLHYEFVLFNMSEGLFHNYPKFESNLTILKTVQWIIFINEVFVWDNKNIVLPAIFLTSEVVDFRTISRFIDS